MVEMSLRMIIHEIIYHLFWVLYSNKPEGLDKEFDRLSSRFLAQEVITTHLNCLILFLINFHHRTSLEICLLDSLKE